MSKLEKIIVRATMNTARMSDEQLLNMGFTQAEIDAGDHLPTVGGGVASSTQILTDLQTVLTNGFLATQTARAQAAAGPIEDLPGMVTTVLRSAQDMVRALTYILEGSQIQTSLTAPTGGLVQSGDSNATTCYNLLTGVYQILK